MNRPRRLLLLVPLALLVTALLVRSRLPHPQTESDKVLWQLGDSADALIIKLEGGGLSQARQSRVGLASYEELLVTNRKQMQDLLRAFKGTDAFVPVAGQTMGHTEGGSPLHVLTISIMSKNVSDIAAATIFVLKEPQGYSLEYSGVEPIAIGQQGVAWTNSQSVEHFYQALRSATLTARRNQATGRTAIFDTRLRSR